ncbi:hypothetical protein D3C80_1475610 [compost metagenome]
MSENVILGLLTVESRQPSTYVRQGRHPSGSAAGLCQDTGHFQVSSNRGFHATEAFGYHQLEAACFSYRLDVFFVCPAVLLGLSSVLG